MSGGMLPQGFTILDQTGSSTRTVLISPWRQSRPCNPSLTRLSVCLAFVFLGGVAANGDVHSSLEAESLQDLWQSMASS